MGDFFKANEGVGQMAVALNQFIEALHFNEAGLVPVITQQYDTKEVLMLAWMNRQSLEQTLTTNQMCYWSRSRQKLWLKGEESGHIQQLKKMFADCDGDALLALVDQQGVACHTLRPSCFFWQMDHQGAKKDD